MRSPGTSNATLEKEGDTGFQPVPNLMDHRLEACVTFTPESLAAATKRRPPLGERAAARNGRPQES
jgi:hypothetical protein